MYEQVDKPKENKSRAAANSATQKKSHEKKDNQLVFEDRRSKLLESTKSSHPKITVQRLVQSSSGVPLNGLSENLPRELGEELINQKRNEIDEATRPGIVFSRQQAVRSILGRESLVEGIKSAHEGSNLALNTNIMTRRFGNEGWIADVIAELLEAKAELNNIKSLYRQLQDDQTMTIGDKYNNEISLFLSFTKNVAAVLEAIKGSNLNWIFSQLPYGPLISDFFILVIMFIGESERIENINGENHQEVALNFTPMLTRILQLIVIFCPLVMQIMNTYQAMITRLERAAILDGEVGN